MRRVPFDDKFDHDTKRGRGILKLFCDEWSDILTWKISCVLGFDSRAEARVTNIEWLFHFGYDGFVRCHGTYVHSPLASLCS